MCEGGIKGEKSCRAVQELRSASCNEIGSVCVYWGGQKLDCGTSVWLVVLYECVHRNQSVYFEVIIKCANKLPEVTDDFVFAGNFCIKL